MQWLLGMIKSIVDSKLCRKVPIKDAVLIKNRYLGIEKNEKVHSKFC